MKVFDNDADLEVHNSPPELQEFLGGLKEFIDGGADYHELVQSPYGSFRDKEIINCAT